MINKKFLYLVGLFFILTISASDVSVFHGQYFIDNVFQEGTFNFTFNVYDSETEGDLVYSEDELITTGFWGQWKAELEGVSEACNNVSKDYFLEIIIDNEVQSPRRRLTYFNYLRKDVDETSSNKLQINAELISSILTSSQIFSTNITSTEFGFFNYLGSLTNKVTKLFVGEIDADEIYINNTKVCRADGTNCISGQGSSTQYIRFISTVSGNLGRYSSYLPLGTSVSVSSGISEVSWVIDRNLTITGLLWSSLSNDRTATSAITLFKSVSGKNSFVATDLSTDIQGIVSGSELNYNISFAQGDLIAIAYEAGQRGGSIEDLSLTFIGHYD